jgi:hypothetical protein
VVYSLPMIAYGAYLAITAARAAARSGGAKITSPAEA